MVVMDKKRIRTYYDKECGEWVKDISKQPKKYIYKSYFDVLYKNASGKRALDVGCGGGVFTFRMAEFAEELYASDLSAPMLQSLQKEARKRKIKVTTKVGDIEHLPFPDNYFDFIVCVGVMECLNNQKKALSEIRRVLKPGGTAAVRWMNCQGIWAFAETLKRSIGCPSGPFAHNALRIETAEERVRSQFKIKRIEGMISFPVFMFPRILKPILTFLFIRTGIAYLTEKMHASRLGTRLFFYSFCTELT